MQLGQFKDEIDQVSQCLYKNCANFEPYPIFDVAPCTVLPKTKIMC